MNHRQIDSLTLLSRQLLERAHSYLAQAEALESFPTEELSQSTRHLASLIHQASVADGRYYELANKLLCQVEDVLRILEGNGYSDERVAGIAAAVRNGSLLLDAVQTSRAGRRA